MRELYGGFFCFAPCHNQTFNGRAIYYFAEFVSVNGPIKADAADRSGESGSEPQVR
jgi:hypothetical protein